MHPGSRGLALVLIAAAPLACASDGMSDAGLRADGAGRDTAASDVAAGFDGGAPIDAAPGTDAATDADPRLDATAGTDAGPLADAGSRADADRACSPLPAGNGPRNLFPGDHFFYRDVSCLPRAPGSDAVIAQLASWGNSNRFQIDFSIVVLDAAAATPTRTPTSITVARDSDRVPFPLPASGALEGESGYQCLGGGDCHLIVIQQSTRRLYEAFSANVTASAFTAYSTAVWDLNRHYGPNGRGAGCTSADAAGFPIAPGLIGIDEVATGEIRHALRFILPNARMRRHAYVAPATHYGRPENRATDSIPYGARLRLRASFDERVVRSAGARAIIRALKRYGMLLADGGELPLTAESDRFSTRKWRFNGGAVDLGPHDLMTGPGGSSLVNVRDFELVDLGTVRQAYPIDQTAWDWPDCVREP